MPGSLGAPGAQQSLERLVADLEQPAIARATALSMLATFAPPPTDEAVRAGVRDDWSLVRRAVRSRSVQHAIRRPARMH